MFGHQRVHFSPIFYDIFQKGNQICQTGQFLSAYIDPGPSILLSDTIMLDLREDLAKRSWVQLPPMPLALHSVASESGGLQFVYVFGGKGKKGSSNDKVLKYDTSQRRWWILPQECAKLAVASAKGAKNVAWVLEKNTRSVFKFDMNTGSCNRTALTLPRSETYLPHIPKLHL